MHTSLLPLFLLFSLTIATHENWDSVRHAAVERIQTQVSRSSSQNIESDVERYCEESIGRFKRFCNDCILPYKTTIAKGLRRGHKVEHIIKQLPKCHLKL
ncbi:hypothetical protein P9112_009309 [Eukaryota sp. TZLM1-RC]